MVKDDGGGEVERSSGFSKLEARLGASARSGSRLRQG